MPGHHLSRMRRLFIRLNRWPCPEGHDSDRCGVASDGTPPSPAYCFLCKSPLSESPTANLDMLSGWRSLCRRLGWERTPGLMNLTVIYDAEDEARAREITDPLIEFLPRLRTCNLRLGSSPAMEGQARLARRTVLALTGREPGPQINEPFPFNKLPWELKLRILEHTHLGTSQTGDYNIFFTRVNVINGRFIKGRLYPESCWRITCCGKCCDSVMDWYVYLVYDCESYVAEREGADRKEKTDKKFSCCISSYAAYSATCQCRVLPLAVFQVSRDFRLAAQQVFYHNAQFCVRNDQLESAFNFVSGPTLSLLRNVSLAMTPAQCYFWPGYCPATAHPQWDFERSVEIYFPMGPYVSESIDPATSTTWPYTYQAPSVGFRTALDILATVDYNDTDDRNEEPPPLDLEKDLVALWIYAGLYMTPGGDDDTEDLEQRFGWVYDLYLDIAHAIHQAFFATPDQGQGKKRRRLGSVNFQLVIFKDLAPWLAREVLGDSFSGNVEDVEDAWEGRRARPRRPIHEKVPSYHSVEYLGGGRQLVRPSRWG